MIIRFLGENVKEYLEKFWNGLKDLNRACPKCHSICNKHGTYQRYVIENLIAILIPIQMLYCKKCNQSHAVIPHFIRPYSPYQQDFRERILTLCQIGVSKAQIAKRYKIDRELIRFWQQGYTSRAPEVVMAIESQLSNSKEYLTNSWWCYLFAIVKRLVGKDTSWIGWANFLANGSGQKVWV